MLFKKKKRKKEVVYFFMNQTRKNEDIDKLEKELSKKIGKRAVILDAKFNRIETE